MTAPDNGEPDVGNSRERGRVRCIYADRMQPSNMRSRLGPARCLACRALLVEGRYGWSHA